MTAPAGTGRARSSSASVGVGGIVGAARREIKAAIRLLTRFPLRSPESAGSEASGAIAFPVVGAVIGLIAAVPVVLVGWLQPLTSLLALALMAVVTGALHLDGLADTADAVVAPTPALAERARKDPAVGPGGMVALLLVLAIQAFSIAAIATAADTWVAGGALVVAAATGRAVAVVTTVVERARVVPAGFAAWFAARVSRAAALGAAIIAALIGIVVAVAAGTIGIAVGGVIGALVGLAIGVLIVRWRRQVDGDALGAITELSVAAVLVVTAIVVTAPVA